MEKTVPKRLATAVMNSLKGGVVPRIGLEYIAVGRTDEINALLHDIDIISEGGATFRFIVGKYGSGKSFLLQTIRNNAMGKGFVLVDADLSPERRLQGSNRQGLATYKELIRNMSTKTKSDGGALPLILEKWISTILAEVSMETAFAPDEDNFLKAAENKIYKIIIEIEGMVNGFDFARAIMQYWAAYRESDDTKKSAVLKWFRGEYSTKTEAKNELGINIIVTDDNWYEFIKLFAFFLVKAGYKGFLVLIDELVNIFKIPNSITRQYNYEKILMMYNDALQGKAQYIGIVMGGTTESIEDKYKGVFSYEALSSRLSEGRFATGEVKDILAPIIRLSPLTVEEMYVLIEKLSKIHSDLYAYNLVITPDELEYFLKVEYERVGASTNITPREIIRDFIELLNIAFQNPNKTVQQIMRVDDFQFTKNNITDDEIHQEFTNFEV